MSFSLAQFSQLTQFTKEIIHLLYREGITLYNRKVVSKVIIVSKEEIEEKMGLTWMLWQDGDKDHSPSETVLDAMQYYENKYGERPNRALVPVGFPPVHIEGVLIESDHCVLEGHLFLGKDNTLPIIDNQKAWGEYDDPSSKERPGASG